MLYRLIFTWIITLSAGISYCQSTMHSLGANISFLHTVIKNPDGSRNRNFIMTVTHFSYFPRIVVAQGDNSSLTIGAPLGAGINLVSDMGGGSGLSWGIDAPVVLDFNIGNHSTPENVEGMGTYFGIGFGYMHTSYTFDGSSTDHVRSYGPLGRVGIRFTSGANDNTSSVGLYFKYGLEEERFRSYGFNIVRDF